jgi:formate-nitrite transporter family protein
VLAANLLGALAFAAIAVLSGAVPGDIVHELTGLGHSLSSGDWTTNLWSGVMAGWLLALVAWVIESSDHVIGQVALIWALTFIIGVASLDHCVSTTWAVLAAVVDGNVGVGHFFRVVVRGNARKRDRRGDNRRGPELRAGACRRIGGLSARAGI